MCPGCTDEEGICPCCDHEEMEEFMGDMRVAARRRRNQFIRLRDMEVDIDLCLCDGGDGEDYIDESKYAIVERF